MVIYHLAPFSLCLLEFLHLILILHSIVKDFVGFHLHWGLSEII